MTTQNARLLVHLGRHGSITSLEAALMQPAIMRLSERIRELERLGYQFDHIDNHNGAPYTRYFLKADAQMPESREGRIAISQGRVESARSAPCSAQDYSRVRG